MLGGRERRLPIGEAAGDCAQAPATFAGSPRRCANFRQPPPRPMTAHMRITTVGLDADDTLWHNESIFRMTQARFRDLMADHAEPAFLDSRLAEVERRNLALYGYGVKGFTLSLIETAMDITGGQPPGHVIADILAAGREMLAHPVEPLPGVEEALGELH